MHRLRLRFTLWRTMALVAVFAVVLGLGIEVFVILPREHPRFEHAAMHYQKAEGYLRLANSTFYRLSPQLRQEFRDLSAWHRRRWEDIRNAVRFDSNAEERIDIEHQRIEEMINFDYAQETRSI